MHIKCFLYLNKKDEDTWKILFHDEISGSLFLELEIPVIEMTKLLRRGIARDGISTLHEDAPLGKTKEVKTEIVPIPYGVSQEGDYQKALDQALLPFEVDGWKANRAETDVLTRTTWTDYENQFRYMALTFTRYLDPETQS